MYMHCKHASQQRSLAAAPQVWCLGQLPIASPAWPLRWARARRPSSCVP